MTALNPHPEALNWSARHGLADGDGGDGDANVNNWAC